MPSGIPDKRKRTPEQLAAAVMAGEVTETIDGTPIRYLSQTPDGLYRGYVWDVSIDNFRPRVWGTDGSTTEGIPVGQALCSTSAAQRREWQERTKNK